MTITGWVVARLGRMGEQGGYASLLTHPTALAAYFSLVITVAPEATERERNGLRRTAKQQETSKTNMRSESENNGVADV
jgi:hypothetical protein